MGSIVRSEAWPRNKHFETRAIDRHECIRCVPIPPMLRRSPGYWHQCPGSEAMECRHEEQNHRRDALRFSGAALGGLALGGVTLRAGETSAAPRSVTVKAAPDREGHCYPPLDEDDRQRYSYFVEQLDTLEYFRKPDPSSDFVTPYYPPLEPNEMRITFMGSCIPPVRRAQQMMSIFVEVGWDDERQGAADQFVFDCGSGVSRQLRRHGGRVRQDGQDLPDPPARRPHERPDAHLLLRARGTASRPCTSGDRAPRACRARMPPRSYYDDGTKAFCENLREACRWHSESFSFQTTSYKNYESPTRKSWGLPSIRPRRDDAPDDGYAMVPIELDWTEGTAASPTTTGNRREDHPLPGDPCPQGLHRLQARVERPVHDLHERHQARDNASIQAINGRQGRRRVHPRDGRPAGDLGHEELGRTSPGPEPDPATSGRTVDATDERSRTAPTRRRGPSATSSARSTPPRLTVATHFPVADDTVACALKSVNTHCPDIGNLGEKVHVPPLIAC